MNFKVKNKLYRFTTIISINESDKKYNKYLLKKGLNLNDERCQMDYLKSKNGYCFVVEGERIVVLRLNYKPKSPSDYGLLQHEISHLVFFIADKIGLKLCHKSSEAFCYLIQFYTEIIYKRLM